MMGAWCWTSSFVAYLDTPTLIGSTPYGKPNEPTGDANADWNVFVGQSTNLLKGKPTWTNVRLTSVPMHHGDVCTLGIFCSAVPGTNRNILDFIDVQVDAGGFLHVAYRTTTTTRTERWSWRIKRVERRWAPEATKRSPDPRQVRRAAAKARPPTETTAAERANIVVRVC